MRGARRLSAELVFLNACFSGSFTPRLPSEVGGFWHALLAAGASALITTLADVHPRAAGELALDFYRHWLAGGTKSAALRDVQLRLRRENDDPRHWASHVLIGYHG